MLFCGKVGHFMSSKRNNALEVAQHQSLATASITACYQGSAKPTETLFHRTFCLQNDQHPFLSRASRAFGRGKQRVQY
jgi:hypothetical protein